MKGFITSAKVCILLLVFVSIGCIKENEIENTPMGNFEELWRVIDEKYCFFDYKQVDWNDTYARYKGEIRADMNKDELFTTLSNMLLELKDGHVNLFNDNMISIFYCWYADSPINHDSSLIETNYLKHNYRITAGIKYQILDNNIGYMYVESFAKDFGTKNLNFILQFFEECKGIIIDVRCNGGGAITNGTRLAARFADKKILTGYICHKIGKGHDEFSSPSPIYLEPSGALRWNKKVAVLTNRQTFSAANEFVNTMKMLPQVTTIGDVTGGGSGLPFYSELPNGWAVRFSASPILNSDMQHTEFGINPDIKVDMSDEDMKDGKDTIIETAIHWLSN